MGSIVLQGRKGSIGFADSAKPMGKKTTQKSIAKVLGRGVWESNPPGTAPSDPPAVLKTVRPTGAPTPPYAWLYFAIHLYSCQARTVFLTKCSDALYIYLGQALHHQLCFA